jgi:protein disulfide-isomerase-like protein
MESSSVAQPIQLDPNTLNENMVVAGVRGHFAILTNENKTNMRLLSSFAVVCLALVCLGACVLGSSGGVKHFTSAQEYDESVGDGTSVYIVKYYAPWCGHCKRLLPVWEALGQKLQGEKGVVIASVDCTDKTLRPVCDANDIKGFPTIKSVYGGESKEKFKGSRDADTLEKFAKQQKLLWTGETVQ